MSKQAPCDPMGLVQAEVKSLTAQLAASRAEVERLREAWQKFDRRLYLLECGDDSSWEEFDGLDSIELVTFLRSELSALSPAPPERK